MGDILPGTTRYCHRNRRVTDFGSNGFALPKLDSHYPSQETQAIKHHLYYRLLKSLHDNNTYKRILGNNSFSNIWYDHTDINPDWLKQSLDRRMDDFKTKNWQIEVFSETLFGGMESLE